MKASILIAELMLATAECCGADVWFAPGEDCTAVIVSEFDKAAKTVDVMAYNFTSQAIGDALIRAEKRGVEVRILLDVRAPSQGNSQAERCKAAGADVRIDQCRPREPIAHNKVGLVDSAVVLAGSFNYSKQANKNAENLTRDDQASLVKEYADNFETHWQHGQKLGAPKIVRPVRKRRPG